MVITLKGNPVSTNHLYKKHGNITYMTRDGKDLKESYSWQAKIQWKKPIIEDTLKIVVGLFFKDKRRRDIDNWHKVLLDSMTGIVWKDDSQIVEMTVTKSIDKDNPRIELEVVL